MKSVMVSMPGGDTGFEHIVTSFQMSTWGGTYQRIPAWCSPTAERHGHHWLPEQRTLSSPGGRGGESHDQGVPDPTLSRYKAWVTRSLVSKTTILVLGGMMS